MNKLVLLFTLTVASLVRGELARDLAYGKGVFYGDYDQYKTEDKKHLTEVGKLLEADLNSAPAVDVYPQQDEGMDARHAMANVLHASLHNDKRPVTLPNGHLVNELAPPVKVVVGRLTKVRHIPNHSGEIVRKVPQDAILTAFGMTPDMLWLRVGKDEYVLTADCRLESGLDKTYEALHRNSHDIIPLSPPLPVHLKDEVTVRKMPSINGKAVGLLKPGDLISAIGATPDYTWLQIGHKQFIPTTFAKLGDPTTPLNPPVTVHVRSDAAMVRDLPSYEGAVVSTLYKGDVVTALAVSTDLKWVKISKNNYVPSAAIKVGLPPPATVRFPDPVAVKLVEKTPVVKNPNEPQFVVRTLEKDDEVLAIGTTEDFKWLEIARKRFIPIASSRLLSATPEPMKLDPPVPIKMGTDTPVRHTPDMRGRIMSIVKKGDRMEAIGVSADFSWLQLGEHMFVPVASAFIRKADPIVNPVVPVMTAVLKEDAIVHKRPGDDEKVVRTIPLGDVVQIIATTPDLEWVKINTKEFIKTSTVTLEASELHTSTTPLNPPVKVVVIRDTKIFKAPKPDAIVQRRIKRGETLKADATTSDLRWLVLGPEYILTDDVAHIAETTPLQPPVRVVAAAAIKARNVPAFSGRGVKAIEKGEVLEVIEVTADYKWFMIGKHLYVPASACVLHEGEGKNMLVVLKARNSPLVSDTTNGLVHPAMLSPAPPRLSELDTPQQKKEQAHLKIVKEHARHETADMQPVKTLTNIRVAVDTPVYSKPDVKAPIVKELPKGTLVNARAIDTHLNWIQIALGEYILIDATSAGGK